MQRPRDYREPTVVPFAERPTEEQEAIQRYCDVSHPSNIPTDIDKAAWDFIEDRHRQLVAGI